MKITLEKTQLEKNLEAIERPLTLIENKIRACIYDLNESHRKFWSLPDDQLLELLNHFGPVRIGQIFTLHSANATAFNALLESRGVSSPRAIAVRGREIIVNEQGLFELVPPVIEEPET